MDTLLPPPSTARQRRAGAAQADNEEWAAAQAFVVVARKSARLGTSVERAEHASSWGVGPSAARVPCLSSAQSSSLEARLKAPGCLVLAVGKARDMGRPTLGPRRLPCSVHVPF